MPIPIRKTAGPRRAIAAAMILLLVQPARAHNEIIHQEMTDLAYQVMAWIEKNEANQTFDGEPAPGWIAFHTRVVSAPAKLRARSSALATAAAPKSLSCPQAVNGVQTLPAKWWDTTLGQVPFAPSFDFAGNDGCGVWLDWKGQGIFANLGVNGAPTDHAGAVLGMWAASIDRRFDDTHLWIRPTSVAGLGAVKKIVNDAGNTALGLVLVPIVCFFECIFGGCGSCGDDAEKAADTLNPTEEIDGWIPGIGDISGDKYVGMWHHLNMNPGASNEFDDHQGELFEEAGPPGMGMDPVDLVVMAVFDATGLSVNYEDSQGVHAYQIGASPDGAPLTRIRDKAQWQYTTAAHTAFEPVDNLAEYGWRRFFDSPDHPVNDLAWPMHAIGDATVPMHVTATSAWGHRPYEDSQEYLWTRVTGQNLSDQEQRAFIARVLQRAFVWSGKIETWRAAHGNTHDVPIRQIVTELAGNTHDYSMRMQSETHGLWPFSEVASTAYLVEPTATSKAYAAIPGAADLVRPLFEDGMGATIALLVAAADNLPDAR
jgi:hypothetical protein